MPAHNEVRRLPSTLQRLATWAAGWCQHTRHTVDIIVVDHGSQDATAEVAHAANQAIRVLHVGRNVGVGGAMRRGILASRGRRVLLCDADGAVAFSETEVLWQALDAGFDLAVGSRRLSSRSVAIPQPSHRRLLGDVWHRLAHLAVPMAVRDTQCGFKLFTRAAAHALFEAAECRSFALHVEILARAYAQGLQVAEIPVIWRNMPGSRVRLAHDPMHMAADLLRLAWRRHTWQAARM